MVEKTQSAEAKSKADEKDLSMVKEFKITNSSQFTKIAESTESLNILVKQQMSQASEAIDRLAQDS